MLIFSKGGEQMKKPIEERTAILAALLKREIHIQQAADLLGCSRRSIERYRNIFLKDGKEGLKDHRHSNYHKLSKAKKALIIQLKKQGRWRSARHIRDKLALPVHESSIWRVLKEEGLTKENTKRVKAIIRFEAKASNDLWQTDIQGKIAFPNLGILYLIATIDDHSRFCLSGKWYKTQGKMNVFQIWYEALSRWGIPKAMLQILFE